MLVYGRARENVKSMWIDEWNDFGVNTDHNLLLVRYECEVDLRKPEKGVKKKWRI